MMPIDSKCSLLQSIQIVRNAPFPCTYKMFCHKFIIWPEFRRMLRVSSLFGIVNVEPLYLYRSIYFRLDYMILRNQITCKIPILLFLTKARVTNFPCALYPVWFKRKFFEEKKIWNHSRDIIVRNSIPTKKKSIYWH